MRDFKDDAFKLIPNVTDWLSQQSGFVELDLFLTANELVIKFQFDNMAAEMGYNRRQLDFFCFTEEALLIAVKKVVQSVIKSVIIGL